MYSFKIKNTINKAKILCIFLSILALLYVFTQTSFAQENSSLSPTPTPVSIIYNLPYPGILPGNPLYVLKVIRDRIILFLISDPLKKAEFDVLMADKRLSAGMYLFAKDPKKTDDISSVISKGNNYLYDALSEVNLAIKQGDQGSTVLNKIKSSTEKHIQVLQDLQKKTKGTLRDNLQHEERRAVQIENQVDSAINKK